MRHPAVRQMRHSKTIIVSVTLIAVLLATAVGAIDPSGLLHLAPALMLALALLARRYPGERLIARLRTGSPARTRGREQARAFKPRTRIAALVARGGQLLARSLAVRPPPVAVRAS